MSSRWPIPLAVSCLLLSCQRQTVPLFDEDPAFPNLDRIDIRPATARVVASGRPTSFVFRAVGMTPEGERDVTDLVSWELGDERLGTIRSGVFETRGVIGGTTSVRAKLQGIVGEASLTVFLEIQGIAEGTRLDAASFFSADVSRDQVGSGGPLIIYPSGEAIFPVNILGTMFQWRSPASHDLFEVRFDSTTATIRYYTKHRSFLLDESSRDWIPLTHRGRSVTMAVRSVSTTSTGTVHRSEAIRINYSESEVPGTLYYWSTGAAAIMRATIDAARSELFFPGDRDGTCVACHTISRDGRRIAVAYGGERLRVAALPDRAVIHPASSDAPAKYGWATFNPTATKLLVSHKGLLELVDLSAGTTSAVPLPQGLFATHPDWSPDGRFVALAITDGAPGNKEIKGSSLARLAVRADGSFGPIEVLVQSVDGEDTVAFPSWSPDGEWIAFMRTRGKSKDSQRAELYLIRSSGSGSPILLERLNRRVGPEDGLLTLANSMPTWAPTTRSETNWLAFSSIRDYGDVIVGTDRDQLWAAAIDLGRAAAGEDPSAPAFWLPFQTIDEGNHRAFWSANPSDACPSTIELCDGADNDCDGVVDEACCTPEQEVCGDGIDNDCDGATDEGCGCGAAELCGNGADDDCDGLVDAEDEDCAL